MALRFYTVLGLMAAGAIGFAVLATPTIAGAAAACKVDATDGCDREGLACNPPAGGKCVTIKTPVPLSSPKLSCECRVPASRSVMFEPPDPCVSAQSREQLLRTRGQQALFARCGRTPGRQPSNTHLPPGLHPLNPQPLPPG